MGRPREHDENTATVLLDACEEMLGEGSPDAIGVRAVARRAGVSTRAVYSLFGGKEGLLRALAARGYSFLADLVEQVAPSEDPAADLVTAGIEGFRVFALEHPGLFRVTFERVPAEVTADSEVGRASLASYMALTSWIERAQAAGVLEDRPVHEIAYAFHSCCLGLATGELSREPPPVGSSFWQPIHGIDGLHLWRTALEAVVAGFTIGD